MTAAEKTGENVGSLIGLCAISASTLVVEIALTKFLGYKFFHHMTFAILSLVILSSGASGVLLYCFPKFFGFAADDGPKKRWDSTARAAAWYAIALALAIPAFCICPVIPAYLTDHAFDFWRSIVMPLLFLILSIPLFCAGLCISQTLTLSKRPVTVIYFFDLLAAALGAVSCAPLLVQLGGYGTMAFAAALGLVAALAYWYCGGDRNYIKQGVFALSGLAAISCCVMYGPWARSQYGMDIVSFKDVGQEIVLKEFGGIASTHWNAIARVDVSNAGTSQKSVYWYGLSPDAMSRHIIGRYILLDGGANTRQFKNIGALKDQDYLGTALWASPYVVKGDTTQSTLIIGGGGGIDVLVAKYFRVPHVTVVEMNPAIYKILKGETDDPSNSYTEWLRSDKTSDVVIVNDEARHFTTTQKPGSFDVIQASGVDTLTAMQTGGMSLVENYLYTMEAVRGYVTLLKPGGILSLTHWRTIGPATSVRMFVTYLHYLDSMGVEEPWRHVVVIGSPTWTDALLKMTPFTDEELSKLREWANKSHLALIFDPGRKDTSKVDYLTPAEQGYAPLAFADRQRRSELLQTSRVLPLPVTDDKPYFYQVRSQADFWVSVQSSSLPLPLMLSTFLAGLLFLVLPVFKLGKKQLTRPVLTTGLYFALCGFAFLLYETAIIQVFSVVAGGPMYSLTVVLVAVLFGYSMGSFAASRLPTKAKISEGLFRSFGVVLFILFIALYLGVPAVNRQLLPLGLQARLVICALVAMMPAVVVGMVVSSAMNLVRDTYGDVVSWMWGISSIFNALGSICFIAITQATGISSCLIIVAAMYLVANLMFARLDLSRQSASMKQLL